MVVEIVLKVVETGWRIDGGVKPCIIVKSFHHGYIGPKRLNLGGEPLGIYQDHSFEHTYPKQVWQLHPFATSKSLPNPNLKFM